MTDPLQGRGCSPSTVYIGRGSSQNSNKNEVGATYHLRSSYNMLKITTCHCYTVSRGRYRNPDSAEEETDSAGLLTVTEVVAGRTRISNLDCSVFKAHGPSVTPCPPILPWLELLYRWDGWGTIWEHSSSVRGLPGGCWLVSCFPAPSITHLHALVPAVSFLH